jgi:hypothetical protein
MLYFIFLQNRQVAFLLSTFPLVEIIGQNPNTLTHTHTRTCTRTRTRTRTRTHAQTKRVRETIYDVRCNQKVILASPNLKTFLNSQKKKILSGGDFLTRTENKKVSFISAKLNLVENKVARKLWKKNLIHLIGKSQAPLISQRRWKKFYSVFQGFRQAKSTCQWWFDFKLEPIFDTAAAASKNEARFKSGQSRLKNNHLVTLDLNP